MNLKKLAIGVVSGIMLFSTTAPVNTFAAVERAVSLRCPGCSATLYSEPGIGACVQKLSNGQYCFASNTMWNCKSCSSGWYKCSRGHSNF